MHVRLSQSLLLAFGLVAGCGGSSPRDQALTGTKLYIERHLDALSKAAQGLADAAPAGGANGWDPVADRAAIDTMKARWRDARVAYESIEGAIAVLFADLDVSTDERYDAFLAAGPDDDLFDDQGVTGVHAIERILWSDAIPANVLKFEQGLAGYQPARFPQTAAEAQEFKKKLCGRLVTDVRSMKSQFEPLALDPRAAYRGIIGSMAEQIEKADKAASGEEESRYAQFTLADMRTNVAAGIAISDIFRPWLEAQEGGAAAADAIRAGFARIEAAYTALPGDALPPVPAGWSSVMPSMADLATPFGQLYSLLQRESDPAHEGSLVQAMTHSADLLGIPQLPR